MTENEQRIVSVHIEKTAGTSLENFFIEIFGHGLLLIWNPNTRMFTRPSGTEVSIRRNPLYEKMRLFIQKAPLLSPLFHQFREVAVGKTRNQIAPQNLMEENFRVIHGHFLATDFYDCIPNRFTTVILRKPIVRMASHYKYWYRTRGNSFHRVRIPFDEKLTFYDFCFLQNLQNYQTQALGGLDLDHEIDLVGTTEAIDQFAATLLNILQIQYVEPPHLAVTKKAPSMRLDDQILPLIHDVSFQKKFAQFHADDVANYDLAKHLVNRG